MPTPTNDTGLSDWAYAIAEDYLRVVADRALLARVMGATKREQVYAQAAGGPMALAERRELVETAIKLAVPRAWLYRFLTSVGQDPKTYFAHERDRATDWDVALAVYPALDVTVPAPPITDEEIFQAATEEVRAIFWGKGSDAHQAVLYESTKDPQRGRRPRSRIDRRGLETDLNAQDARKRQPAHRQHQVVANTPAPFVPTPSAWEDLPVSRTTLRVAAHLLPVFGQLPTLYWIFDREIYPDSPSTLLRCLGGVGAMEQEDPKQFAVLRHDLTRKLALMNDHLSAFAADPDLRDAYDAMLED